MGANTSSYSELTVAFYADGPLMMTNQLRTTTDESWFLILRVYFNGRTSLPKPTMHPIARKQTFENFSLATPFGRKRPFTFIEL